MTFQNNHIATITALVVLGCIGISGTALIEDPPAPWKAPARADRLQNPIEADEASLASGKSVYNANCLACHGSTGKGDGPAAAAQKPRPEDLGLPLVRVQSDGALFWKITRGRPPMPAYKKLLTEEQRWHVLNYIRSFAPKLDPTKPVPPKFDIPAKYREAISTILQPYLAVQETLEDGDAETSRAQVSLLVQATVKLRAIDSAPLSTGIRSQWQKDVDAIWEVVKRLPARSTNGLPFELYHNLSDVLIQTISHFGHAQDQPLRVFTATKRFAEQAATWIQTNPDPENPYVASDSVDHGTLIKTLGQHQTSKKE